MTVQRVTLGGDPNAKDWIDWREAGPRIVEITDIVVNTVRRQGRGKALLDKLLKTVCVEKRTAMIYAITRVGNEIAQSYYESQGFRVLGRLHRFYPPSSPEDGGNYESALAYGRDL